MAWTVHRLFWVRCEYCDDAVSTDYDAEGESVKEAIAKAKECGWKLRLGKIICPNCSESSVLSAGADQVSFDVPKRHTPTVA